ncbi:MAG: DUF2993 domain-containing protein [Elainella sp.]
MSQSQNQSQNLGEQALSKVAEVAISSQLDQVEQVNVEVKTDPLKLMQGKLEGVSIAGEGMVVKQDLRAEAVGVTLDSVAINPMKAVWGEIELTEALDAQAQILLTESDINRALASDYLRQKMQQFEVNLNGQPTMFSIQQAAVQLEQPGQIGINLILQPQNESPKQVSAVAKPCLKDAGRRIDLEILSAEAEGLSLELIMALFQEVIGLLDLRNFEFNGSQFQLQDLDIQPQKMLLRGAVTMEAGSITAALNQASQV